jgi:GT2 family glycosyltransferase
MASIDTLARAARLHPGRTAPTPGVPEGARPRVAGKFLFSGDRKLFVRGVTYGPMRDRGNGDHYPDLDTVERDFGRIAANGMNAVRTYTAPPARLLDCAERHGLWVMAGLPWEQHVAFLQDRRSARSIEERVRAGVRSCRAHPAILCYAIGNEIPASIVRWHGPRRVEAYLQRLTAAAREEDPDGLFTYASYPTTEYLRLPFVDFLTFNIYLEDPPALEAYLARLHNIAGNQPVVVTELGIDAHRNGEALQAETLSKEVRTAFAAGCAGAFVFAWTDEWHRGGEDIRDWSFGLTDGNRRPRPALAAVANAFAEVPFPRTTWWPRISVVVCTRDGARTIRECFEGLRGLDYPDFEVIVVNDGSVDATADIASEYGFRVITTENRGLSSARNTGLEAATGAIVAYIDDDAYPDPHWLTYLAATFMDGNNFAGVGGPNIPPADDGLVAESVAAAPGGPIHVLLSDREAEHIPGCNMAFRKTALEAVGGFDTQFRVAGDDVDVCWRLHRKGWKLGFSPSAVVWHHRRTSVREYWRQQCGYGAAEALLERKWPEKYNSAGHLTWAGQVYTDGRPRARAAWRVGRIYQGVWGTGPFQSARQAPPSPLRMLLMMPEWYLILSALAALCSLGALWSPLLRISPLYLLAIAATIAHAALGAGHAIFAPVYRSLPDRMALRSLTAFLHAVQPLARLGGRLRNGLTPWRRWGRGGSGALRSHGFALWSERWRAPTSRLESLEAGLAAGGAVVARGGEYDRWDLEVRGGTLGAVRLRVAVEEHGRGRQLVRIRVWPRGSPGWLAALAATLALYAGAALGHAWGACAVLGTAALLLAFGTFRQCATASGAVESTVERAG